MVETINKHVLSNGMVLLGEFMEEVESVAFGFMLPAGEAVLPQGCGGAGNVICDWIFRGAGQWESRALGDALDGLGLHRAGSVGSAHITIGAAAEASNLAKALGLYADIILRAKLGDNEFEPARQLAIDAVAALDDDPRGKVMLKLREQFYPAPLGRSTVGEVGQLKELSSEQVRELARERFNLSGTIFAVAGKHDFDAVVKQCEQLFGGVETKSCTVIEVGDKGDKYTHVPNDGAQVHIGLMTETVKVCDEDYYNARVAISVLGGGMSSRLFTEVREKRGLCYSVGARYHGLKEAAGIACYVGTVPDKAQETLDVIMAEFNRLSEGISEQEIERAKVGLKSSLIMSTESSSSRAGAIGSDHYMLGRVRSLNEIKEAIDATSVESVLGFLQRERVEDFTVVTIGPKDVVVK